MFSFTGLSGETRELHNIFRGVQKDYLLVRTMYEEQKDSIADKNVHMQRHQRQTALIKVIPSYQFK